MKTQTLLLAAVLLPALMVFGGQPPLPAPLSKTISVDLENVSFEKALSTVAAKGKFKLNYNRDRIPAAQTVSLKMKRVPAISVLRKLMEKTGTQLTVTSGGQLVITPKPKAKSGGKADDKKKNLDLLLPPLKEQVEVSRDYFHGDMKNPVSVINVSSEEVRRAPGAVGCVSRALRTMPGITAVTDATNEMIIRGGSPLENGFYIDNIEVPNINHLPALGSNGGSYSALHPGMVRDVEFYSGGFSSDYGGHLSSVTDITFREGNRERFGGNLGISTIMGGGIVEGPLLNGRGAFLVAFRKSWLEWTRDNGIDLDHVPETFDSQVKLTLDIEPRHKVNLLHLHGSGSFRNFFFNDDVRDESRYLQNTTGVNWLARWTKRFFSNTSLSYSYLERGGAETIDLYNGGRRIWEVDDEARFLSFRNVNVLTLSHRSKLEFGFRLKYESAVSRHNSFASAAGSGWARFQRTFGGLYVSYTGRPLAPLTATLGLRADYSSAQRVMRVSPRISLTCDLGGGVSLNGGFGEFYQALPLSYLAYTPGAINLKDMKATHYILGLKYFPGNGTKFSIEVYRKQYRNLPVNPDYPYALFSDWLLDRSVDNVYGPGAYFTQTPLTGAATGYSRGIELLVQKKLVGRFYSTLSASFFTSRYKDFNGILRPRIYDNQYVINLAGMYKAGRKWEFSLRLTMMGGAPYTPIDVGRSNAQAGWTLDMARFNSARYPDYISMSMRINRRFRLGNSNLLLYLEVMNFFDTQNVSSYYWTRWNHINVEHQLPIVPIFGIEYSY